ncbi:Ubiquinol-cytochrome C reductase iron-sulfur subunit [Citrifermentans bremense]|uniref:2Fe-2S-binding protein n=2 Tax=Geobacteraceae TaxID=213422 RepID=A0ABQ0ME02_9BACT|nr:MULTISPECIES: Rieske 2Fe-2S domain-containing protein [Geobacteraceae]BCG48264.1 Ubiquinol-cytochrome C reductase iron-sulfur subunit [Citrifermentans bremense]GAW65349.1 2Fe-2S-binding protein [Geoanaerobacter pelophilus]
MELNNCGGATTMPGELDEGRRSFVKKVTATTLALGVGGIALQTGRFLKPNVLYEPARAFKVGDLSIFPIGSRIVIEGRGVEIVRERDGIHAVSLTCTHLGCLVKQVENDPDVAYACPCHGSTFAHKGEVLGGPAPKDLPWFEMYMDHTGALVVDTSKVNRERTKLVV